MSRNLQLSVVSEDENVNTTVLRIASSAKNSITQFYAEKVFVNSQAIKDLHRKITDKLRLHYINDVSLSASIQFENDRTINVDSIQQICETDYQTDALTQLIVLKWSFIFDGTGNGDNHLHSIYVRISEGPNPGLVFQRMLSKRNEDLDSLDTEMFAPVVCKVDFMDSRFSNEILSIVVEWASALPKAEPISEIISWLRKNENKITSFTSRTFPAVIVLAYIGIWFGYVADQYTSSVKFASAWVLGGAVIYQLSSYMVAIFNKILGKQIRRISDVPVFMITSGDNNKITKHLSKSKNSAIKLAGAGLIYGAFKGIGLYLATNILW
jgi:hypothetical protein